MSVDNMGEDSEVVVAVAVDTPSCYICLDSMCGLEGDDLELIAPCACQTFVHRRCLDDWHKSSNSKAHCQTCKSAFEFEEMPWTKRVKSSLSFQIGWRLLLLGAVFCLVVDDGARLLLAFVWEAFLYVVAVPIFAMLTLYLLQAMLGVICIILTWGIQSAAPPRVKNLRRRQDDKDAIE